MAGIQIGSIFYDLSINTKDFERAVGSAGKTFEGLGNQITQSSEKFAKAFLAASAVIGAAAVAMGKKAVDAYNIQAEAEAKLIQLHKENTGATDEQVKSLMDQASALQKSGVIGDEAIINGQAQLSTFKLSTEAIKSLTPAMADMVAQQKGVNATGADFVNVGNLIGKVMEGQVGALGRYGVSFSEAQEEILKTGNETERAATLAEVLAQNYGGVNEALRATFAGEMQASKNTMSDFMELIGETIVKYIGPLIKRFNDWADAMGGPEGMIKKVSDFLEKHGDKIKAVSIGIMAMLIPAFVAWTIAAGAAAVATLVAMAPLILLGAAVAGAAYIIIKNWDKIKAFFNGIPDFFRNLGGKIVKAIVSPFNKAKEAVNRIAGRIKESLNKINPFARFSPSLVDNVRKGVGIITKEFSQLTDIGLPTASMAFGVDDGAFGGARVVRQEIAVNVDRMGSDFDLESVGRELGFKANLT